MGRKMKRTRIVADDSAAVKITIRSKTYEKKGTYYTTHLVQGWKEGGKWKRKEFKELADAERFAALKRVTEENQGRKQQMVLSPLTEAQHEEARIAFDRLAGTYSLTGAVDFFLKHHRPPEFTIAMSEALKLYLDDKERDGLRDRSVAALRSVISQLVTSTEDAEVHTVTAQSVEGFLRGLRAKDGISKASRKTWNNYRNDLNGFFSWSAEADQATNRPYTFENPVSAVRKFSARQVREEQSAKPETTSNAGVIRLMSVLMRWRGGALARYYALLYFAGIRPEELKRLSPREAELVNLRTRTITIPANISKTRHERHVPISENLAKWMEATPGPIIPPNFDRLVKKARKHFQLSHDEPRHTFISFHVALHRSIGDAALVAGNSETIIRRHYLNLQPAEEGATFFSIVPSADQNKAEKGDRASAPAEMAKLKAI
jgi:hypothetical protein